MSKKFWFLIIVSLVVSSINIIRASKASAALGDYDYQYIEQSAYPDSMQPGESTLVWIKIKNTGRLSWYGTGNNITRLGSGSQYGNMNQKRDYLSEFYNGQWKSGNRPANVGSDEVKPGEETTFAFNITAPLQEGLYKAYFTPVVDGITWMKDIGIYWEIKSEKTSSMGISEVKNLVANSEVCNGVGSIEWDYLFYNNYSKTWWVNLGIQGGCFPACVINEETKTAEINWRCTGAL